MTNLTYTIFCCQCEKDVESEPKTGKDIYPYRGDLWHLILWQCPTCKNSISTHRSSGLPLGTCIATKEVKKLRMMIHRRLDPLWRGGKHNRRDIYRHLSDMIGEEYHTANVRSVVEAELILKELLSLAARS